ncbi:MAG: Membrane protein [Nitrosopumilales archaeon]|nr:MAG: Membrane protein [Nitrosopumilales archaeon]
MQRIMLMGGIVLVAIIVMLFTLPDMIGLEFTIAMSLTMSVLMGIYVILVTEVIHRTALAMIGALFIIIILIYTGLIPAHDSVDFVIGAIDFNTIGLLLGMMIIVGILGETGVFQYIGIRAAKLSKGNVWKLMVLLSVITAVGSAFLDNVTMVLLIVPVTISVARVLNINPISLILAEIFASNVGGASTLIGDPPNIMIASAANIDFMSFAYHMTPEVIITFAASFLIIRILFRKDLKQKPEHIEKLMQIDEKKEIKDMALLKKSVIVLFGVVIAFMFHGALDLEVSIIALAGAAILLVITRLHPAKAFTHVEWTTLMFFAGLFIIVSGVELTGALELFAHEIVNVTGGNFEATAVMIIWSSAFASAFVDNIPYTATMIPIIENISLDPNIASSLERFSFNPLWYALAIGADFGGNGTLIGASANLVAIAVAERHGHRIMFRDFLVKGLPYMIATVAIGTGVFLVRLMLNV